MRELKVYDELLNHIAYMKIGIDLDVGVKKQLRLIQRSCSKDIVYNGGRSVVL